MIATHWASPHLAGVVHRTDTFWSNSYICALELVRVNP